MPLPARRMLANTSFLPSTIGLAIFSSGVSISTCCVGVSRVTS